MGNHRLTFVQVALGHPPFVKDGGYIFSKWGAALPSEKGLIWTYHDGENFVDDTDITCDVANSTRRA